MNAKIIPNRLEYFTCITHATEKNRATKELLREGAKLIDDLCSAFKVTLPPDDQKVRDDMAKAGGE